MSLLKEHSKKIKSDNNLNKLDMMRSLETFQNLDTNKQKAFYLCQCNKSVIKAFTQLFKLVLSKHIKLPKSIKTQLKPFKQLMQRLVNPNVSMSRKRKTLSNTLFRQILYPFMKKHIIPSGLKFIEKMTGCKSLLK